MKEFIIGVLAFLIYAFAVLALFALFAVARAHNNAQWIADGGYRNAAGELCCGVVDCGEYVGGSIVAREDGYHVQATFAVGTRSDNTDFSFTFDLQEVVPYSQALPSPDSNYWACRWGGERKCFFAPPPAT